MGGSRTTCVLGAGLSLVAAAALVSAPASAQGADPSSAKVIPQKPVTSHWYLPSPRGPEDAWGVEVNVAGWIGHASNADASGDSSALAYGVRPEVFYAKSYDRTGIGKRGFGVYADLSSSGGHVARDTVFAGGLEGLLQTGALVAIPSIGASLREVRPLAPEGGVTAGCFLGLRMKKPVFTYWMIGARLDGRMGLGPAQDRMVAISFETDVLDVLLLPVAVYAVFKSIGMD